MLGHGVKALCEGLGFRCGLLVSLTMELAAANGHLVDSFTGGPLKFPAGFGRWVSDFTGLDKHVDNARLLHS